MTDNIFMISDASFSNKNNYAGIGVIDLSTGKKYSQVLHDIPTSNMAEYRALLLSVRIAIKNEYNNVVFVYDNKNLQLDTLKEWLKDKIQTYQFLWLKRVYVEEADKLANKARRLYEKLISDEMFNKHMSDGVLVKRFKQYTQIKVIGAFLTIADHDERVLLKNYLKNQHSPVPVASKSLDFYSDVYCLLKRRRHKISFLSYIEKNYAGTIDIERFKMKKSKEYYPILIKKILKALSTRSVTTQSTKVLSVKTSERTKIQKLKTRSYQTRVKFFLTRISGNDKDIIKAYFFAKKTNAVPTSEQSIELLLFFNYILPKIQQKSFFGFINNKLKKDNRKLHKLWYIRDETFYLKMARKVL